MKLLVFTLVGASIVLSACGNRYFDVEIKKHVNDLRQLVQVIAIEKEDGITVFGYTKRSDDIREYKGHVDIAAFSQDGVLLVETTAKLNRRIKKSSEKFSVNLGIKLSSGSIIKAALHQETKNRRSSFKHKNIFLN